MPVTLIQEAWSGVSSNGDYASVTFASTPVPGNHLILGWSTSSTAALPEIPSGFTEAARTSYGAVGSERVAVSAYREVQAGDSATVEMRTLVTSPGSSELHVWEVSGIDKASPVGGHTAGAWANSTTSAPGSLDVTAPDGAFLVALLGAGGTTGAGSVTASFSDPAPGNVNHTRFLASRRIVAAPTTGIAPVFTWTTARAANSLLIEFLAAAPAPPYRAKVRVGSEWVPHAMRLIGA